MIILLLGLLIAGLGLAYIVYSGSRDHASELILLNSSGDSPSAGGAERPVDRPVTLGPGAVRGASRTPSSLVIRPGDEVAPLELPMPIGCVSRGASHFRPDAGEEKPSTHSTAVSTN